MFATIQYNVNGNSLSNKHAQLIHLFKLIDETLKVQLINGYGMSILITLDLSFALLADKMNLQPYVPLHPAFCIQQIEYKEISLKAEAKIAIQFKIDDRQNKTHHHHHHHHDHHEIEANGRLEILQVTYC